MEIASAAQLLDFLGVEEEHLPEVEAVRSSAIGYLCKATGVDWTARGDVEVFNEALRVQVWLSYYAVRDAAKNSQFLRDYLTSLLCSLQLSPPNEVETR